MRILITGGAGFVGSNIALAFRRQSSTHKITVLDNLKRRGSEINLPIFRQNSIEFVHGDIRNVNDLLSLEGNFDVFIEASAEPSVLAGVHGSPNYAIDTNLTGTLHCLEFARKRSGIFLFLSTSRVYSMEPLRSLPLLEAETRFQLADLSGIPGMSHAGVAESFQTQLPKSFYGATKLCSEMMIQEYIHLYGLRGVINRCGVICGPGQFGKVDQGVFSLWVVHHYFGRPLSYTGFGGNGKQVRDLLHPDDTFALIQLQIENIDRVSGEVFNVGGGNDRSASLFEMTRVCEEIVGRKVPIKSVPNTTSVDIPFYVSDCRKVERVLGWKPNKSVSQTVGEIHSWLTQNEKTLSGLFNVPTQPSVQTEYPLSPRPRTLDRSAT